MGLGDAKGEGEGEDEGTGKGHGEGEVNEVAPAPDPATAGNDVMGDVIELLGGAGTVSVADARRLG